MKNCETRTVKFASIQIKKSTNKRLEIERKKLTQVSESVKIRVP